MISWGLAFSSSASTFNSAARFARRLQRQDGENNENALKHTLFRIPGDWEMENSQKAEAAPMQGKFPPTKIKNAMR